MIYVIHRLIYIGLLIYVMDSMLVYLKQTKNTVMHTKYGKPLAGRLWISSIICRFSTCSHRASSEDTNLIKSNEQDLLTVIWITGRSALDKISFHKNKEIITPHICITQGKVKQHLHKKYVHVGQIFILYIYESKSNCTVLLLYTYFNNTSNKNVELDKIMRK